MKISITSLDTTSREVIVLMWESVFLGACDSWLAPQSEVLWTQTMKPHHSCIMVIGKLKKKKKHYIWLKSVFEFVLNRIALPPICIIFHLLIYWMLAKASKDILRHTSQFFFYFCGGKKNAFIDKTGWNQSVSLNQEWMQSLIRSSKVSWAKVSNQ